MVLDRMKIKKYFLILVSILCSLMKMSSALPECKNYAELKDSRRSISYFLKLGEKSLCDTHIDEQWYRFGRPAGDLIPTHCPRDNACGTTSPVWINGSLPRNTETTARLTGCQRLGDDCCFHQWPIFTRRCKDNSSTFYIFFLRRSFFCAAYCAEPAKAIPLQSTTKTTLSTEQNTGTKATTQFTANPKHKPSFKDTIKDVVIVLGCVMAIGVFIALGYLIGKKKSLMKNSVGSTVVENKTYHVYDECS